ncbi:ABC transporter ATP-binding protein [Brachybacterium sp. Marseille-Q7125]|uniref:ABC transporter ATP-binding protein n=1 Tax=Brachybacterium sp. Marseille-Q7125 TaxID=2932815 RepID=UPI001FF25C1F|nr:ABC transporter ATP-binding protein [Brachybacterium sp. Marseille-Q7125]
MTTPDESSTPILRAHDLRKSYTTTEPPTEVLRGIDLEVSGSEFLAVMGASGSGKSTLLHLLGGLDRPTAGHVEIDGTDLTALSDRELSRVRLHSLGFVFQQPYFLDALSIRDNVLLPALKAGDLPRAEVAERVDGLLERFGIAAVADHRITEASGGQLQRASICRALAVSPRVVLADEPTGALNSAMATEVMEALAAVHAEGTTVVMVTHDPRVAAAAQRVLYLEDGRILDTFSRAEHGQEAEGELRRWLTGLGF